MIILPTLFGDKDEIEILSPFPKAIHTSNDIRAIILRQYPNVKSKHIIVSDPESDVALIVGDNDVYQGWIKVTIRKLKEIKMLNIENQSNYTLTKLIRTGISPICAMIGTSAYYGQVIANPILGSLNSLLFGKKLGLDIWNLNQRPNNKTKLINSSKKILLGLGTIGLANYSKWTANNVSPIIPTTPIPTTTEGPPWLLLSNQENQSLMDWDTYISLNAYGITNVINGLTELIPNRFATIRKIANMATGGYLISSGVAMGINNDFNNAYAVPTIIAGISEIIHNLLPMETIHNNTEMQETSFTNETTRLINDDRFTINSETSSQYGSHNSNVSLDWDDTTNNALQRNNSNLTL